MRDLIVNSMVDVVLAYLGERSGIERHVSMVESKCRSCRLPSQMATMEKAAEHGQVFNG